MFTKQIDNAVIGKYILKLHQLSVGQTTKLGETLSFVEPLKSMCQKCKYLNP